MALIIIIIFIYLFILNAPGLQGQLYCWPPSQPVAITGLWALVSLPQVTDFNFRRTTVCFCLQQWRHRASPLMTREGSDMKEAVISHTSLYIDHHVFPMSFFFLFFLVDLDLRLNLLKFHHQMMQLLLPEKCCGAWAHPLSCQPAS